MTDNAGRLNRLEERVEKIDSAMKDHFLAMDDAIERLHKTGQKWLGLGERYDALFKHFTEIKNQLADLNERTLISKNEAMAIRSTTNVLHETLPRQVNELFDRVEQLEQGHKHGEPAPCPYCGSDVEVSQAKEDSGRIYHEVVCTTCNMTGPEMRDRKNAVQAWNEINDRRRS